MNTRASAANLSQAVKELVIDWEQIKASWRDVKSREFEEKFLEPIPSQVARATAVIEEIDAILRKVKADCE